MKTRNINCKFLWEKWKTIPNYEGLYKASTLGRIKTLSRQVMNDKGLYWIKTKILKPGHSGRGYLSLNLYKDNNVKHYQIAILVARTFMNHIPNGIKIVIDHKDNDKHNNRLSNLQLITHRNNCSKDKVGSSKYTGVSWNKREHKWTVHIRIKGKSTYLGSFQNEEIAAECYNNKVKELL